MKVTQSDLKPSFEMYAFENIDPKSVRTFQTEAQKEKPISLQEQQPEVIDSQEPSLSFASEIVFPNLRLIEPVEVLKITPFLLSKLKLSDIQTVGKLLSYTEQKNPAQIQEKTTSISREKIASSLLEELRKKALDYSFNGKATVSTVDWERILWLLIQCTPPSKYRCDPRIISLFKEKYPSLTDHTSSAVREMVIQAIDKYLTSFFQKTIINWISLRGNMIFENELLAYCYDLSEPSSRLRLRQHGLSRPRCRFRG